MFDDIKRHYLSLSKEDRRKLIKELQLTTFEDVSLDTNMSCCPHCSSHEFTKHGKHKGEQRYHCRSCKRTFKSSTGTAIGKIKKKREFLAYQDAMLSEGYMSLDKMSKKFNISIQTSFTWRHKVLLSIPETASKIEGEAEMDDLWFLYSQKGRKGLQYSRERGGTKHKGDNDYQVKVLAVANKEQVELKVSNIGRVSQADIHRSVGDKMSKKTTLMSDKHQSIAAYANNAKIKHINFKASEHTADGKGVQRVNNMAERLKTMVNRTFRGVSTKYLQMYANWFKTRENHKADIENSDVFQKAMLSNKKAWDVYSNIESIYERFIKSHSKRTYRCPVINRFKTTNWNKQVVFDYAFI